MARYTRKALDSDLEKVNQKLAPTGYFLAPEGRNGYVGLDLYKGDYTSPGSASCQRTIKCGSARQCIDAAYEFVAKDSAYL